MPSFDPSHDLGHGITAKVNYAENGRARLRLMTTALGVILELNVPHDSAKAMTTEHDASRPVIQALIAAYDPKTDI